MTLVGPQGERRAVHMKTRAGSGGRVIARVDGLHDREEARALIGWTIEGAQELLPPLREGEYYHRDLLGLEVWRGETCLGRLVEIHSTGPVDVWTVRGDEEHFVPALRDFIQAVDLEAGVVRVKG